MAILSFYECQIRFNGVALQEYDDEDGTEQAPNKPTPIVVKYVEATSGAEFSIKYKVHKGWKLDDDLSWQILLDGKQSNSNLLRRDDVLSGYASSVVEGVRSGSGSDWRLRKFKFADIVNGDLANHLTSEEMRNRYSSLGVIRVQVWRYQVQYVRSIEESGRDAELQDLGVVPEKALKGQALSLSTSLGVPEQCKPHSSVTGRCLGDHPIAVFEFRYRSRTALQQLMIIPRSPTPVPLEDRPIEDLSAEEARELLRRQNAEIAASKVKSESKLKLKRARSSTTTDTKAVKIARTADGREYIDLRSDSEDGNVKEECTVVRKEVKKSNAKTEIINLLD